MQVLVPHGMRVMNYRAVTAGLPVRAFHNSPSLAWFAENSCQKAPKLSISLYHHAVGIGNDLGSSAKGTNRAPWHLCLCLCTQWSHCLLTAFLLERKKGLLQWIPLHHSELSALFFDGFYIKYTSFISFQFLPQSFFLKLFYIFLPTI